MAIEYQYDQNVLEIIEKENEEDTEFTFRLKENRYAHNMHQVRNFFEQNDIYTDVLFYTHNDYNFQVIVRNDFYIDFLLQLFKEKIILELRWK